MPFKAPRCITLFVVLVFALPCAAIAQCTGADSWDTRVSTGGWVDGVGGSFVRVYGSTRKGDGDPCRAAVQAEAWLNPGGNPTVQNAPAFAETYAVWTGNFWGVWTGTHKHWYVYDKYNPYPFCCDRYWQFLGQKDESVNLGDPPPPPPPPPPDQCQYWDPPCVSPIIISLGKRADIKLTSVEDGVWFDINGDGILDRVAWTREGSDDGFLVLDRNGNGVIDNGRELFGTATIKSDGTTALNGFNALLDLDGGATHTDGRIDENDPVYEKLRIWIDRNHNGISEPDELISLRDAHIISIQTGYSTDGHEDRHGNVFAFAGTAIVERRGVEVPRVIYDVFLTR